MDCKGGSEPQQLEWNKNVEEKGTQSASRGQEYGKELAVW